MMTYIRSKNKLAERNDRLKIFFDTAFEGIAITYKGKFMDGNDRFFEMFGYTKEEMIDMPVRHLVYADDIALVQKHMKEGYSKPYEHRCIHKNGSICYVEVHGRSIRHKGQNLRLTAIHDLTHIRKAEKDRVKLKDHQNQISKLEAIGSFAGGIVHDFNNALQPIIGNCDIILYEMKHDSEGCQLHKNNIEGILKAAEIAKDLISKIQSFSRKNGEDSLEVLNLSDCIEETFVFLKLMLPKKVEIELNIETISEMVVANEITIKQVLINLCKNSMQSMEDKDKGRICINVTNKKFDKKQFEIPEGEYIKIEIIDNGKGMSPEVIEHAFDPYFTTKREGTGIGLSIVNRIIRNYDGFIRLYSKVGKGTLIVIYIPVISQ